MVFGGGGSVFRVFLAGENSGIVHPVCGVGAGEMGFGTCVRLILEGFAFGPEVETDSLGD